MNKTYGYRGEWRFNDAGTQAANIRSRLENRRSEDWDAARADIQAHRVANGGSSVADQVKRNIEFVLSDQDSDMEPLFVY